jgi:hypothetical protein
MAAREAPVEFAFALRLAAERDERAQVAQWTNDLEQCASLGSLPLIHSRRFRATRATCRGHPPASRRRPAPGEPEGELAVQR